MRYEDNVSDEPIATIRELECETTVPNLIVSRFRRLFNELEDASAAKGEAEQRGGDAIASCAQLIEVVTNLRGALFLMLTAQAKSGAVFKGGVEGHPMIVLADAALATEQQRQQADLKRAANENGPSPLAMQLIQDAHGNIGFSFNRQTANLLLPPADATNLAVGILRMCGHRLDINPGAANAPQGRPGILKPH